MRKREQIKQGHEKAVADQTLKAENVNATFQRIGDADRREPDAIYRIEGRIVGIEVATAYYDDTDAQDEWEIATGERRLATEEMRLSSAGVIGSPDQSICKRLQAELEDKCGKAYTGTDKTWLCINVNAPLSDRESMATCARELKIPPENKFARIYVTYTAPEHEGGEYVAIRIS